MEENNKKKSKTKVVVISCIIVALLLTIGGANVYASTHGYGNVFFLIKYLVTGEKPNINDKNELLSDRDITLSYEPINLTENIKIQIRNIQIKDNKAKLLIGVNEKEKNNTTPLKYKVYNESDKLICDYEGKTQEDSPSQYIEELMLNEFKNDDKILKLEIYNAQNEKLTRIIINLETREITVEGEEEAVNKISEIELKKYLSFIAGFEANYNADDGDNRISLAIRINTILNRTISNNGLFKATEINNILKSLGYTEIPSNYSGEFFKEKTVNGEKYYELIYEPDTVNMETIIGEIKSITYSSNVYTVKFKFLNTTPKNNMNYFDHEAEAKEATVYLKLNEDKTYSMFKVVKYEKVKDSVIYRENNELIGSWKPEFAEKNGKEISLMEIYGSAGATGEMNFDSNGKYTAFIGTYSSEIEDDLKGDYINGRSSVTLIANSGKKDILTIKRINGIKYLEKNIENTTVYFVKKDSSNEEMENEVDNTIEKYMELLGERRSSVSGPLYKLGLIDTESTTPAKKQGYMRTNVVYSKFKEEILKYMTEQCFQKEINTDEAYIDEDGYLCYLDGAGSAHSYTVINISKVDNNRYKVDTKERVEETVDAVSFEVYIVNSNGKNVVQHCRKI